MISKQSHLTTGIIIEARLNSSRLPKKHLLRVNEKYILEYMVERLKLVDNAHKIILATTTNSIDDELVSLAKHLNIEYFRGSELNVMDRVISCAEHFNIEHIVEICGDCPLIDHNIVDHMISLFNLNNIDYLSNTVIHTFPLGMDTQVFKTSVLKKSQSMTSDPLDLEHVTRHIINNPSIFSIFHYIAPPNLTFPNLQLTLDEKDDYSLIKQIIQYFSGLGNFHPSCFEIIDYIKENMHLLKINSNVKRTSI